jgi:hypothetical protein
MLHLSWRVALPRLRVSLPAWLLWGALSLFRRVQMLRRGEVHVGGCLGRPHGWPMLHCRRHVLRLVRHAGWLPAMLAGDHAHSLHSNPAGQPLTMHAGSPTPEPSQLDASSASKQGSPDPITNLLQPKVSRSYTCASPRALPVGFVCYGAHCSIILRRS